MPHDAQMSSEHVEITRQLKDSKWSWRLKDLDSTNGTFVRISETPLSHDQELFIGGRLYRFQSEEVAEAAAPVVVDRAKTMMAGDAASVSTAASANLLEVTQGGPGKRIPLQADQWIGRDNRLCQVVVDDPMVGDQEARIYRDKDDHWFVKKGKSLNGVWVRVTGVAIQGRGAHFQCGEQRFEIRLG
jgi:pSer/pThr/pTyr-binding forkhead associated (FHA) protein